MPNLPASFREGCGPWRGLSFRRREGVAVLVSGEGSTYPVIEVDRVAKTFVRRRRSRKALDEVSFAVSAGRSVAVVGESGAGKSTLVRCVAGLEKPSSGRVRIQGRPLDLRPGHTSPVQVVFQNPTDALDPMRSIGSSIAEPLRGRSRSEKRARVSELVGMVGLSPDRSADRPRSFSGGQLQRIVIARALASSPAVLLCDEPTSALDVSVQAQIVNLLLRLQKEHKFAMVVVTHDLAVAKVLADDVIVLRGGMVLFQGSMEDLLEPVEPLHPYVENLVQVSRDNELHIPGAEEPISAIA
ncbi:dipeptide/oligopeptide/nickel ABC transporter ATP-binding protein [Amycolatopsis acidiphila]|nr:dipeptide/oligopeptide/nickel ABC transporter ATP-binding protein [Amycolatopsis acidiphila]UIJ60422.1 dipeptide/oligopeptide/nickel ABC transporter ATP-binding protein [Amycolatopsis acidiphila]